MIEIKDLYVTIEEEGIEILKGLSLTIKPGETHAIMGPNGSGKSTLSKVIAGDEQYEITSGDILINGESILEMDATERALMGVFLAFQYPVEIPGVNNASFLRMAYNAKRKHDGLDEMDPIDFEEYLDEKLELVGMSKNFKERPVNFGFSGGEKKRNEILQMAVLNPIFNVLDETDSGLDIDALKGVADAVNKQRRDDNSFLLITHYQRLLDYIVPDVVHVMADGRIIETGGKELALELDKKGYDFILERQVQG